MSLRDLYQALHAKVLGLSAYVSNAVEVISTESILDWPLGYFGLILVALFLAAMVLGITLNILLISSDYFIKFRPRWIIVGWEKLKLLWAKAVFDTDKGMVGAFFSAIWASVILSFPLQLFAFLIWIEDQKGYPDIAELIIVALGVFLMLFVISLFTFLIVLLFSRIVLLFSRKSK